MGKELKSFFKNNFPNFLRSKLFFSKNIMILKKFKEEKKNSIMTIEKMTLIKTLFYSWTTMKSH